MQRAHAANVRRAALQACVIKYDEEVGTRQQTCAAAAAALAQVEPWPLPAATCDAVLGQCTRAWRRARLHGYTLIASATRRPCARLRGRVRLN
jgi:hypothetical protein